MYIYNETLQGVVDGVNKTFTTLNKIEKIEEVYVWGNEYRDVSFIDNVVTFLDAIPLWADSPSIDYFVEDLSPVMPDWSYTFWELIDDVYMEIGQDRESGTYLVDWIKRKLNQILKQTKNDKIYNNAIRTYSFNCSKSTTVSEYSPSYINVGTLNYIPSSSIIHLNGNLIEYTNYTDWKLLWMANYVYKTGDIVQIGYKLPEWIKNLSEVKIWGYKVEYTDIRNHLWNEYQIVHYKDARYLMLPYITKDDVVTVKYFPEEGILVNDSDIINFEYEYMEVLSNYVTYKMLMSREDDRWANYKKDYLESLKRWKWYKSRTTSSTRQKIGTNSLKGL